MRRGIFQFLALLSCLVPFIGQAAADPVFTVPANCVIGQTCFVQNYVDTDDSPAAADFTCGQLVYDGHKGTDIRLRNYVAMENGVDVLAAAAGTVLRLRDGMADVNVRDIGAAAVKDRMAGNSVIVDHGDGWVTQYAHLKLGSIVVTPGQHVVAGDKLGQVGLSGNTEFPHLHFEVRHDDKPVDPFTGETMGVGCNASPHTMWRIPLAYQPTGLLSRGFALVKPEPEAARHGAYSTLAPSRDSAALVFWVDIFGLQKDDRFVQQLLAPDGSVVAQGDTAAPSAKAQYFSFIGKKKPAAGWQPGTYLGILSLQRAGKAVIQDKIEIQVP